MCDNFFHGCFNKSVHNKKHHFYPEASHWQMHIKKQRIFQFTLILTVILTMIFNFFLTDFVSNSLFGINPYYINYDNHVFQDKVSLRF